MRTECFDAYACTLYDYDICLFMLLKCSAIYNARQNRRNQQAQ